MSTPTLNSTRWYAGIAALSLAAVAAALVSQHVYGMEPCPWCVLQRLIFVAIALACAFAFVSRWIASGAVIVLSGLGIGAALWQHFVASKSQSCNLTLADRVIGSLRLDSLLPDVFSPRASCADATVNLVGVPYELWSLALFVLLAGIAVMPLRKSASP